MSNIALTDAAISVFINNIKHDESKYVTLGTFKNIRGKISRSQSCRTYCTDR